MKFKSNKIAQYLYERKSTDGQQYILNHEFYSSGSHKRVKGLLKKKNTLRAERAFLRFPRIPLSFSIIRAYCSYLRLKGELVKKFRLHKNKTYESNSKTPLYL